jgi:hypothetical protein
VHAGYRLNGLSTRDDRTMRLTSKAAAFAWGAATVVAIHLLFVVVDAQPVDTLALFVNAEGVMRVAVGEPAPGERRVRLAAVDPQPCPAPKADLASLQRRVADLEGKPNFVPTPSVVSAPFEVVDDDDNVVFRVDPGNLGDTIAAVDMFDRLGRRYAHFAANPGGGAVGVSSVEQGEGAASVSATLSSHTENPPGLHLYAGSSQRLAVGSREGAQYGLMVLQPDGKRVAGIGGEIKSGAGIMGVFNNVGMRARLATEPGTNFGQVSITDDAFQDVVILSGGGTGGAGLLQLKSASGTVMVEASTLNGHGVVRAGPGAFQHGKHIAGLPASYIEGVR